MEVKKRLTADEFAELLPQLGHADHVDICAARRVLVDGVQLELVASELSVVVARVATMAELIWSRHLDAARRLPASASISLTLSLDMAGLIKQMARQVEQHEAGRFPQTTASSAEADTLNIALADILPDSSPFPDDLPPSNQLVEDIRTRGVKRPISVRPHPTIVGKWLINDGHRRFRAAQAAGLSSIPHFVDACFDSYDQVNLHHSRDGLSPWVLAGFVARRRAEGDSKGYIAQRLGKEQSFVTAHLALVDAPACLHLAYSKGVASPRTLYDLRRAYDEFPAEVEHWCIKTAEITRKTLQVLLQRLRRSGEPG